VVLPTPHSQGQGDVIRYPGNVVLFAGRRWGKTQAGIDRFQVFGNPDPGLYWWVGLSWKSASMKRAWRLQKH
jgi:hypothetical protein